MITKKLRKLCAISVVLAGAFEASAQLTAQLDFDSVPSGSEANLFSSPLFSFHEAFFVPSYDSFGDPIPGSEHWETDTVNDALYPVTVENPEDYGRGTAPSPNNALQALFQPVVIWFDQPYRLLAFSATLDNDTFGLLDQILFVTPSMVRGSIDIDQSTPGLIASLDHPLDEISGIVLPSGAFYDNISFQFTAVPEPATYGVFGILLCATMVGLRHRRRGALSSKTSEV